VTWLPPNQSSVNEKYSYDNHVAVSFSPPMDVEAALCDAISCIPRAPIIIKKERKTTKEKRTKEKYIDKHECTRKQIIYMKTYKTWIQGRTKHHPQTYQTYQTYQKIKLRNKQIKMKEERNLETKGRKLKEGREGRNLKGREIKEMKEGKNLQKRKGNKGKEGRKIGERVGKEKEKKSTQTCTNVQENQVK
jgi:hypothetical protein